MKRLFLALVWCLTLVTSAAWAADVPAGYDRGIRPDPAGTPTVVKVGVFLIDIIKIDDIDQSFTASLYFDVHYSDPRLADPSAPSVRSYALNEIWWPDLGLVNRRNVSLLFPDELRVDPQGNVEYTQRVYGDFSARLNLREFPFDTQNIPIEVISYRWTAEELDLVADPERSGRFDALSLSGWELTGAGLSTMPTREGGFGLEQLAFYLEVERKVPFYRWSILIPLCLIVLMAWCVFWIDPQYLPSQIGLSTATVFSLIAFRFSLRAMLPKVDYMTYLDEFVFAATVLVFSALGQAILTGRLAKTGREVLAHRIDVGSRIIYLLLFAIVLWTTLRGQF